MKAAVFHGAYELHYEDIETPKPKADEVLVKVKACGVCGTDVHIYQGALGASKPKLHNIIGHEFAGEVVEVGDAVRSIKVGDRVTVNPNDTCGMCTYCQGGKEHFCENMLGLGTTTHGGFAEYCVAREKVIYKADEGIPFNLLAMTEPVACCLHGIDLAEIRTGDTVLIIGGGTIGMMMLQLAKLSGASTIVLSEPLAEKRELGQKLGADVVIDPVNEVIDDVLKANGLHVDVSIECVGHPRTMQDAIRCVGNGGNVMLFGLTDPDCEIPVKPYDIFRKEITIRSSFINPYTHKRALDIIASGKLMIDPLIHKVVPLEDIQSVFEEKLYRDGKIIVCP